MRPEHIDANRLIDLAEQGDREAYRAMLRELEQKYTPALYDTIKRMAARQYRMATKDYRFFTWRADWLKEQRVRAGNECNQGRVSDGKVDDQGLATGHELRRQAGD